MNWILAAFLEPVLHAWANILDSNLINRVFKNAWALTVFIAVADILFLPIIWFLDKPDMIPWALAPYVVLISFIELAYSYPYYKALEDDDTSVAISLFSLGKVLVPVFAFIFIGERLNLSQYFGFLLIILSSSALTFNRKAKFSFNKSFFYMLLSSSMLAVETVTYKHVFNNVSWGTGFFWTISISAIIGLLSFAVPGLRKGLKSEMPNLMSYYHFILLVGIVGFVGNIGYSYAISQVPPTISSSIGSTQPIFVLMYAAIFSRYFPLAFKEKITWKIAAIKSILFICIAVGVFLTIN